MAHIDHRNAGGRQWFRPWPQFSDETNPGISIGMFNHTDR